MNLIDAIKKMDGVEIKSFKSIHNIQDEYKTVRRTTGAISKLELAGVVSVKKFNVDGLPRMIVSRV